MTLLAALVGAVVVSFSAIFFALSEVSPITGAFFRAAYAIPALFLIWYSGRTRDSRSRKRRLLALAAGAFLGVDVFLWHTAIDHIGTGLATLIANAQVIFVAVGAWLIQGEKPNRKIIGTIPVVLFGVAMVSGLGRGDSFGANPILGAILALIAAIFYAGFILGFRASNQVQAPVAGALLEATVGSLLAVSLIGVPFGPIDFQPSWPAHGWLIGLALGAQVLGWLLIGYALPRLPAVETATIILTQPVLTMIWGVLIFSESPSLVQVAGAAIVLAGVGFIATNRARLTRAAAKTF